MFTAAVNPSSRGITELMPMIGTLALASWAISVSSASKEATITASALRRTGSISKKSRRSSMLEIWKIEIS